VLPGLDPVLNSTNFSQTGYDREREGGGGGGGAGPTKVGNGQW
jgi:hypothetical protein